MADLGNRASTLRLQCQPCGWPPPENTTMEAVQLHFQVDHDTDKVHLELVPLCSCGEPMTTTESRPWPTGGIKHYLACGVCGNTGYLRQEDTP